MIRSAGMEGLVPPDQYRESITQLNQEQTNIFLNTYQYDKADHSNYFG